jgi:hypothetical protein
MYCTEREHLLAQFETAVRAYQAAVLVLRTTHGADFEKANTEVDRLKRTTREARASLDRHRHEHDCVWLASEASRSA